MSEQVFGGSPAGSGASEGHVEPRLDSDFGNFFFPPKTSAANLKKKLLDILARHAP
ncbi:MAG: hypothetical protein AB1665_04805 [Candidatus Thermoplasmatota archaeon]